LHTRELGQNGYAPRVIVERFRRLHMRRIERKKTLSGNSSVHDETPIKTIRGNKSANEKTGGQLGGEVGSLTAGVGSPEYD